MTDNHDGWTPTLPGVAMPELGRSHIEASATATLAALDAAGLLRPEHALVCQVVLELARTVGRGLQAGKVTVATATLSKHLLEAIDKLPALAATPAGGDPLAGFMQEVQDAANGVLR